MACLVHTWVHGGVELLAFSRACLVVKCLDHHPLVALGALLNAPGLVESVKLSGLAGSPPRVNLTLTLETADALICISSIALKVGIIYDFILSKILFDGGNVIREQNSFLILQIV